MIKNLLFSILSWVIAFNLIIFFRNYGQPGELHWPNMIIGANTAAIVVAIIFSLVDTYHDKLRVKRKTFLQVIVVKNLVFILAVFIAIVVAVFTIEFYSGNFSFSGITDSLSHAFTSPDTLVYILYALVISFIFYFYKQLSKNISQDLLTNILLSKYIQPKEEARIFMFLDLTSATAIAEKLGAFNYSSFLQDFFYDLDTVMQETLGDADETQRNQAVENHYQWVNAAKFLGCHSIRVNAAGEGTADEVKQAAVEGLGKLTQYGAQNEINIIVENHGGYSSDGKWLTDVMSQVNSPYCGTLPDFGNFKIDEGQFYDPYQGIKELMPFAKGVSAKSYDFDTSKEGFVTTGARNTQGQELDYLKLLKIVKDAGFTGYIGIEYEGNIASEMDGIRATKDLLERAGRAL